MISEKVYKQLSSFSNKKYIQLTSRATTALYFLLKENFPSNSKILVSPIVCPHVIFAIIYAGFEPLFMDIDLETFNLDPNEVSKLDINEVQAAILVDIYGLPLPKKLIDVVAKKGIPVIYDRAQSFGNKLSIEDSVGEVTSFGYSKLIDINYGGVIFSNIEHSKFEALESNIDYISMEDLKSLENEYRYDYYNILLSAETDEKKIEIMSELILKYKPMLIHKVDHFDLNELSDKLIGIDKEIENRKSNAKRFFEDLGWSTKLHFPKNLLSNGLWRLPFLIDSNLRDNLVEVLREKNLHVSTWYPNLASWFKESFSHGDLTNATKFQNEIVNFWVDETVDDNYFDKVINTVKSLL